MQNDQVWNFLTFQYKILTWKQQSSTALSCLYLALMVFAWTSYNLTVSSQEETRRNWELLGPNLTAEMPSSGQSFSLNSLVASGIVINRTCWMDQTKNVLKMLLNFVPLHYCKLCPSVSIAQSHRQEKYTVKWMFVNQMWKKAENARNVGTFGKTKQIYDRILSSSIWTSLFVVI